MAVLGALSVTMKVPVLAPGVRFCTDPGLVAEVDERVARFRCDGQERDSVVFIGGPPRKRLHHISLRAEDLDHIAARTPMHGGRVVAAPAGFEHKGLWIEDLHGMLIHLTDRAADPELSAGLCSR